MDDCSQAELDLMEKMYELELENLVQGYISNTQTEGTILLSLIFGYLLVAHFVGDSLSKVQTAILNSLYLLTVTAGLAVYTGHYQSIVFAVNRLMATGSVSADDIPLSGTPGGVLFVIFAYSSMILASLYFMYTVRRDSGANERDK